MKFFITLAALFFSQASFALDVCAFDQRDGRLVLQCTNILDSELTWSGTDIEWATKKKAELIQTLLSKGYELKSENIFIKK